MSGCAYLKIRLAGKLSLMMVFIALVVYTKAVNVLFFECANGPEKAGGPAPRAPKSEFPQSHRCLWVVTVLQPVDVSWCQQAGAAPSHIPGVSPDPESSPWCTPNPGRIRTEHIRALQRVPGDSVMLLIPRDTAYVITEWLR